MKKHIFNYNKLVIASHNEGKVEEIKIMLKPLQIEVLSANDFNLKEPIEDGNTFEKNALIKSSYVCKNTGIPSLSDDSGICFCDLNNEPGIYSARWAGKEKNFNLAMSKINDSIKKVENPKNRTSTTIDTIPMITRHSATEKNSYRSIKNSNLIRAIPSHYCPKGLHLLPQYHFLEYSIFQVFGWLTYR